MKVDKVNIKWHGDKIIKDIELAAELATRETAESVLEESNKIVPLDTGELRDSGKVVIDEDGNASVTYDAEHAVAVHETPKQYRGGRKYKFLETALNKHAEEFANSVKGEVGKALR